MAALAVQQTKKQLLKVLVQIQPITVFLINRSRAAVAVPTMFHSTVTNKSTSNHIHLRHEESANVLPSQTAAHAVEKIVKGASDGVTAKSDIDSEILDEKDENEQEEMFVTAHETFEFKGKEWGGPRRGGRLPEPTRFGDWERKGRCTDF